MRVLSTFSGISAASVAWKRLGYEFVGFAEIEPFPCSVLAARCGATAPKYLPPEEPDTVKDGKVKKGKRWPRKSYRFIEGGSVPNFGDISQITDKDLEALGPVDVLEGGSPCQAFSVAGLREGLADARGNLTLEFVRLALRMRRINGLKYVVWENVPGVLNHADNPLGCLMAALVGEEGGPLVAPRNRWPNAGHVAGPAGNVAWRVLDAQHWGVPQRRRRIFLVANLGDGPAEPGAVLFERDGVRGSAAAGGGPGQETAGGSGAGAEGRGGSVGAYGIRADAMRDGIAKTPSPDAEGRVRLRNPGLGISEDVAPTVDASSVHAIAHPACWNARQDDFSPKPYSPPLDTDGGTVAVLHPAVPFCDDYVPKAAVDDTAYTLLSGSPTGGGHKQCVAQPVAFAQNQLGEVRTSKVAGTLNTNGNATGRNAPLVCQPAQPLAFDRQGSDRYGTADVGSTLRSNTSAGYDSDLVAHRSWRWIVRRLLPVECERLQGFPDGWTAVEHQGKPAADGPRYKSLGNSMAVPCMAFIGRRLMEEHRNSMREREAA